MTKILRLMGLVALLALGSCSKQSKIQPERTGQHRMAEGEITRLDELELRFFRIFEYTHPDCYKIPVTLLEVSNRNNTRYYLVLTGEHVIHKGDVVTLEYIIDDEVTGEEIFRSFYEDRPSRTYNLQDNPTFRYKGDGLVHSWRVESSEKSSEQTGTK